MGTKFNVEIIYEDESSFNFDVELEGSWNTIQSELMMITRGTLMASTAVKAVAYNDEGFDVCSYIR